MKIDLMSISGHKIYGPKGVGALYVRRRPRVRLVPLIDGGGQERGLRSGTLPTPLCVGLGRAAAIAARGDGRRRRRGCGGLRDRLQTNLMRRVPGLRVNGDTEHRLPGNLNLSFPGLTAPELIEACPRSRCRPARPAPRPRSSRPMCCARSACRTRWRTPRSGSGLGRFTTADEVDFAADALAAAASRLYAGHGMTQAETVPYINRAISLRERTGEQLRWRWRASRLCW